MDLSTPHLQKRPNRAIFQLTATIKIDKEILQLERQSFFLSKRFLDGERRVSITYAVSKLTRKSTLLPHHIFMKCNG